MQMIKRGDQGWVQDERSGNPGFLLRTVSLPINQVPEAPPSMLDIQDAVDSEDAVVVDEARRRSLKGVGVLKGLSEMGLIWETWNVGWIRMDEVSLSLITKGLMILRIENGMGLGFLVVSINLMFRVDKPNTLVKLIAGCRGEMTVKKSFVLFSSA